MPNQFLSPDAYRPGPLGNWIPSDRSSTESSRRAPLRNMQFAFDPLLPYLTTFDSCWPRRAKACQPRYRVCWVRIMNELCHVAQSGPATAKPHHWTGCWTRLDDCPQFHSIHLFWIAPSDSNVDPFTTEFFTHFLRTDLSFPVQKCYWKRKICYFCRDVLNYPNHSGDMINTKKAWEKKPYLVQKYVQEAD